MQSFKNALDKFVGGKFNDGVVSLESQLCRSKSDGEDFSFTKCSEHMAIKNWNYIMPNKPDHVDIFISEKDVWHGRFGCKPIFTRFKNFEVVEGSKEMFDYQEARYRLSEFLGQQIDRWMEEA
ncbi:MAG: hypothetical protein V3581_01825 [Candidatus Cardinium sp.]